VNGAECSRARPAGIAALVAALALLGSAAAGPVVAYADADPTPLWEAYPLEGSRSEPVPAPRPTPSGYGRATPSRSPSADSSGGPGVMVLLGLLLVLALGLRVMPRRPAALPEPSIEAAAAPVPERRFARRPTSSNGAPGAGEPAEIDSLWTPSA